MLVHSNFQNGASQSVYLYRAEHSFEKGLGERHVLGDVRLEMPCSGLPIICRVAHPPREKDKFVRISRGKNTILSVAPDHPKAVDEHPDEEIRLA